MKSLRPSRSFGTFAVDNCTFLSSVVLLILLHFPACAGPVTVIDFDSLRDGDIVTNQFPGITFTNAIVLSAGISLNEFEFPPHSGSNVVSDNGGPISIVFGSPALSYGAYFTYAEPLMLSAFNTSNIQIASATSAFSSNDTFLGDVSSSPNEFLQITFAGGISSVTIAGDPGGDSFVMDDVTFQLASVPEPSYLPLTSVVALAFLGWRIRK